MTWLWWRFRLEYAAFRLFLAVLQILPHRVVQLVAWGLGAFTFYVLPRKLTRYAVARDNLRQAFGDRYSDVEIDRIIKNMWGHLFLLLAEIAQLSRRLSLRNLHDVISFRNKREVVQALSCGRPAMLLSGHFGNWEMAISVFGLFGFRMGVVARDLTNPLLQKWFVRFRESTGHTLIAKKGCFDDIIATMQNNGCIALLADQDAGKAGVFVEYFGKPASTPKTIALLALEYDALICVGYARRVHDPSARWSRFELGCEEVIDPRTCTSADPVGELTQRYTAALERVVRRAPEQYFWVHRRWKSSPGDRRRQNRKRAA